MGGALDQIIEGWVVGWHGVRKVAAGDCERIRVLLREGVKGYVPENELVDWQYIRRQSRAAVS